MDVGLAVGIWELLSSSRNITHSTTSSRSPCRGIIHISLICVGEGGRLTRVV